MLLLLQALHRRSFSRIVRIILRIILYHKFVVCYLLIKTEFLFLYCVLEVRHFFRMLPNRFLISRNKFRIRLNECLIFLFECHGSSLNNNETDNGGNK